MIGSIRGILRSSIKGKFFLVVLVCQISCQKLEPKSIDGMPGPVQKILAENCVSCHSTGSAEAGLGYIDKPKKLVKNGYIVPGEPAKSKIYTKVSSEPPFGARMPYGGPYLNQSQIDEISRWIESMRGFTVTIEGKNVITDPSQPQLVPMDETLSIDVKPISGFELEAEVGGDCPRGEFLNDSYMTGPITSDCTVKFSANGNFQVKIQTSGTVLVSPSAPQMVRNGNKVSFKVEAKDNTKIVSKTVGGNCPSGTWSGSVYTTGDIIGNCEVAFSVEDELIVTPKGSHVVITPSAVQYIQKGRSLTFKVVAEDGYKIVETVLGDCPIGSWTGSEYTTGMIQATCSVEFTATTLNPCPTVLPSVKFSPDIVSIIESKCARCHDESGGEDGQPKALFYDTASGVRYDWIMAGENKQGAREIVKKADPKNSLLYLKTTSNPAEGVRMPKDQDYLTEESQSKICNWIYYGAGNSN